MGKFFKKNLALLTMAAVVMSASLYGCAANSGGTQDAAMKKVGILQIVEHPALDASRAGFLDALSKAGYVDKQNIVVDYQNAQGDASNLKTMSQKLVQGKSDIILAIATPTAQAVASETKDIPILVTACTDPVKAELVNSIEKPGTNVTGTSDMTPVAKQLDLMYQILPTIKKMAIMYNSSEVNSKIQADIAIAHAKTLGIEAKSATVTSSNDVSQVAESLIGNVDAIYIPTDNTLASAMPILSKIAIANNIPVIGSEPGEVEGGALITDGIDYYKLGYLTGEMAVKILKGESKPQDMAIQYASDTTILINKKTADALHITIPDEIMKKAGKIFE